VSGFKCAPCGREFSSLTGFDRHQDVDYDRRPAVRCLDPAARGLEQNDHGRWHLPQTDAGGERLAALRDRRAS
jgi:hypothetical protein